MDILKNQKGQAVPGPTRPMGPEAFAPRGDTLLHWMGNASIHLNSRGTNLMIDPLLEGFDMPLLIEMPIQPKEIPTLDGVLITHIDNDHFSRPTCKDVQPVCRSYHAPQYVAEVMRQEGLPGTGHAIGETFRVGNVAATLTPAEHNWQNESAKWHYREWKLEDYCGYWLDTPDGSIWLPGDSRLLESHLHMPQPDLILLDFSDNSWHITLEGAARLANAYPEADLVCIHWGSVDAPDWTTFNGNPEDLLSRVTHPERVHALAPGEPFVLHRHEVRK